MCAKAGVPIVEDCAQAHGARRGGKSAGSFGTIACFSFYPTKNLGALGDGGAIVTNDPDLAERVRQIRQYGWSSKYTVSLPGGRNSRLDELQAAVLREKLPFLDAWNDQRRAIAVQYSAAFSSFDLKLPPSVATDFVSHLYVIRTPERAVLMQALRDQGIASDIHYPIPDHRQPAYGDGASLSLPLTEEACDTVMSLPCFPGMTDVEVKRVIAVVTEFFSAER
ncbi:dTDP-3-amino-3,6-dideoxy-alpha-D-galactopyranose transaminase [compost metagenome]